ncbi:DUF2501 domain-containing protein [Roseomonas gilardii subsp. gilardii]|uniref:DUF2501 domain-containing protein n=1 Tax=Roseomonas gilardii TaxID=257708 RepID=UPI001FF9A16C|nr:DUF2501 domain-containing protein [Roseomonas gilardii]UPG73329.1 DUF2501 domain-containing protein [Roseomonas gilardii subsp. gilardii]
MRHLVTGLAAMALLAAAPAAVTPARAQLMDTLKNAAGNSLGGIAVPSPAAASSSNIAGLMQYCVQQRLVSGTEATSVKDQLLGKLGGTAKQSSNPGFAEGSKGVLDAQGKSFDLASLKSELGQKLCEQVLQRAKSLL